VAHAKTLINLQSCGVEQDARDEIAESVARCAAILSRLFLKHANPGVSRSEIGILCNTAEQPRRITELAMLEGVTQPAISQVVNRLVDRGWIVRAAEPNDRRAALVTLTTDGREAWGQIRAEYRALLHDEVATLDDEAVEALARATDVLDLLITRLTPVTHHPAQRYQPAGSPNAIPSKPWNFAEAV
jgi:DNA-binding MarR family transcriptional regulator